MADPAEAELDAAIEQVTGPETQAAEPSESAGQAQAEAQTQPGEAASQEAGAQAQTQQAPAQAQDFANGPIKVAGREYPDLRSLVRSHGYMHRDYSKVKGAFQQYQTEMKPWAEFKAACQKDPGLYETVKKAIDGYYSQNRSAAQAAQAQTQRPQYAQLSPEDRAILQQIQADRMVQVNERAATELDREINALMQSAKPSKDELDKAIDVALEYAEDGVQMPMDRALRLVRSEANAQAAGKANNLVRRLGADVKTAAGTNGAAMAAAPRGNRNPATMSEKDFDAHLDSELKRMGITD